VRGIPAEYVWYNVSPAESRGRFQEAYDLIMTAWTQPVWSFHGKFFQLENCAIWPRPVQQPHPPIWVAARSAESIEWCVKRRLPIAQVYQTTDQIEDTFNYYRKLALEQGWRPSNEDFVLTRHIHVDESDEKARAVAEPALRYFFRLYNRGFNQEKDRDTPEMKQVRKELYTETSFNYFRPGNERRLDFSRLSWEDLDKSGYVIAGAPDTVVRKLNEQMKQVGAEHFMGMFHIGNLPHQTVVRSLELFAEKVAPRLRS
jgi:alkanesulfonate monooxygenase SsuD/methylene tetrahydromethanopterin reductase-like flavin-dependent oxidoreductase (luciferase family)